MSLDAGSIPAASTKISIMKSRSLRHRIIAAFLFLSLSLVGGHVFSQRRPFLRASLAGTAGVYRVLVESSFPLRSTIEKSGNFLSVKIRTSRTISTRVSPFTPQYVKSMKWDKGWGFYSLAVEVDNDDFFYDSYSVEDPPQLFVRITPRSPLPERIDPQREAEDSPPSIVITEETMGKRAAEKEKPAPKPVQKRHAAPERRTIVIDPGHGGMENGAKGKDGSLEKDITLAIGLRLKSIIEKNLAFNVVMTRDKDVEVSLESRAAVANNNKAFLFVSIHANSSYRKNAFGSESYFLSLNSTDREARRLAYLENNSEELGDRIGGDDEDQIKMILWDMAQSAYLKQSSELAENIQQELNSLLGTRNRGIKQAPFMVLAGVACPAVLVEVAFINNPKEEEKLNDEKFQENAALAIYRGLVTFIRKYT
jgi:N-acetylmuramoyl-L-alanine amidase